MSFYTFNQNNSGGNFDFDAELGISHYVIVEADTADEAIAIAEDIGLYFDGDGDCACCGKRWSEPWGDDNLDEVPSIYGEPVEVAEHYSKWMAPNPETFVHYKSGEVKAFS